MLKNSAPPKERKVSMSKLRVFVVLAALASAVGASDQQKRPGWLGFAFTYHAERASSDGNGESRGWLLVRDVIPQTPAARVGLRPNDMVIEMAGKPFRTADAREALRRLARIKAGESVAFLVVRDGKKKTIIIKAGPMPEQVWERWQKILPTLAEPNAPD